MPSPHSYDGFYWEAVIRIYHIWFSWGSWCTFLVYPFHLCWLCHIWFCISKYFKLVPLFAFLRDSWPSIWLDDDMWGGLVIERFKDRLICLFVRPTNLITSIRRWLPSLRMLCSVFLHLVFLFGLFWFVSFFFPDHLSSIRRLTPFPADAAGSGSREICQQKLLPGAREPRKPWEMAALFFHRHSLTWNGCFVIARNKHIHFLFSYFGKGLFINDVITGGGGGG